MLAITPGREVTVYQEAFMGRVWKATFPGQSGFGQFGYYTPAGYLRRLRLSNRVFGDDVAFEGIWQRKGGLSIVTSQSYIQPHPVRFIPTEEEIATFLEKLGFTYDASRDNLGVSFGIEPRFLPTSRLGRVGGVQIPPAGAMGLE